MKDFLLVLFYQAIVALNTAVILNSIIWLAKRKEEKDGRKPNPDFTPAPTKHRGGYQPKPCEMPKPPTTGTNVIEPKRRWDSWDEDDVEVEKVIRYAVEHECSCQAAKLDLASGYNPAQKEKPPTTGSAAIKPKCGISADEAAKLVSKLAEASACLGGSSELDELRERAKDFADRLDRAEKKPVTQERLKEAGLEVEYLNAKCGECKNWKRDNQIFGHCALRRCHVKEYERRQCQFFEKWEPPAKTTHICRNCKHYLATDEEYLTGTCGLNEEITFANSTKACFESKPSTSIVRPKPLGTITTH